MQPYFSHTHLEQNIIKKNTLLKIVLKKSTALLEVPSTFIPSSPQCVNCDHYYHSIIVSHYRNKLLTAINCSFTMEALDLFFLNFYIIVVITIIIIW